METHVFQSITAILIINALHKLLCLNINIDASIVHTSDTGQLQANLPVVDPMLPTVMSTRRAVTMMRSNDCRSR